MSENFLTADSPFPSYWTTKHDLVILVLWLISVGANFGFLPEVAHYASVPVALYAAAWLFMEAGRRWRKRRAERQEGPR